MFINFLKKILLKSYLGFSKFNTETSEHATETADTSRDVTREPSLKAEMASPVDLTDSDVENSEYSENSNDNDVLST
jgi:hypothetical protein